MLPRLLGLAFVLGALAVSCGGEGPEARATPTSTSPAGARTGAADAGEAAPGGRPLIRSSLQGTCRLTPQGAEIRVEYTATALGPTILTRVRLLEEGRAVEDSGLIEQRQFQRVAVYQVDVGEQRTYRLATDSEAGAGPSVQTTVRCGTTATATPAPRA